MSKSYIPGGKKRRVQEFLRDADYFDKLSPADRQWLLDNYIKTDLNNNLTSVKDQGLRRKLDYANSKYYADISNRSVRVGLNNLDFEIDFLIQNAIDNPLVSFKTETKDPNKRRLMGRVMTPRDYQQNYDSSSIEDAVIAWIDSQPKEGE